jgi:hypothetical protein
MTLRMNRQTKRFKHGPEELQTMLFFDLCAIEARKPNAHRLWSIGFHIPNERRCSIQRRITLSKCGVRAGVPDLFFPISNGTHHGLFIEMKVKPNKPSPVQLEWIQRLTSLNYMAVVAYSADEAINVCRRFIEGS